MICCRCDEPIRDGEPHETLLRHSLSGPGTVFHRHARCPGDGHPDADPGHTAAYGRLMTHLTACVVCRGGDLWGCMTAKQLRRAWRAAERNAR